MLFNETIFVFHRDVSGVELLMNNHKSLKAEIDAREENFSICLSLGRTLLNRRHPREEEIRDKCIQVSPFRIKNMALIATSHLRIDVFCSDFLFRVSYLTIHGLRLFAYSPTKPFHALLLVVCVSGVLSKHSSHYSHD